MIYSFIFIIHSFIHSFFCPFIKFDQTFVCHPPSISSSAKKTQASIIYWVEWRWNWRIEYKAICSSAHSFARATQPFACSALLALFAYSAMLTRSLIHSLPGSWAWGLCIWIECIDHLQFQFKVRSLARSHHSLFRSHGYIVHSLACSLTRFWDHGKMCYIISQFQHVTPTPRQHTII